MQNEQSRGQYVREVSLRICVLEALLVLLLELLSCLERLNNVL